MSETVISLVFYLAIGWCVARIVDAENTLINVLVTLFWPVVVILAIFVFMFWG